MGSEFDFLAGDWLKRLGRVFSRVAIFEIRGGVAVLKRVEGFRPGSHKAGISLQDGPLQWSMDTASPLICIGDLPGTETLQRAIGAQGPHFALIPLVKENSLHGMAYADQGGLPLPLENVGYLLRQCEEAFAKGFGVEASAPENKPSPPASNASFKSTSQQQGYSVARTPPLVAAYQPKIDEKEKDVTPTFLEPDEFEEVVSEAEPEVESAAAESESARTEPESPLAELEPAAAEEPEIMQAPPPAAAHDSPPPAAEENLHVEPPPPVGAIQPESEPITSVQSFATEQLEDEPVTDHFSAEMALSTPEPASYEEPESAEEVEHVDSTPPEGEAKGNFSEREGIITPRGVYAESEYRHFSAPKVARVLGLAAALLIIFAGVTAYSMFKPGDLLREQIVEVDIPPASSLHDIAHQLEKEGVVASAVGFKAYTKVQGVGRELKAGHYRFPQNIWTWDVLAELRRGQIETMTLTLPEGLMLKEVAEIVAQSELVSAEEFIAKAKDKVILQRWNIPGQSAEGYLFPETYTFAKDLNATQIVNMLLEHFFSVVDKLSGGREVSPELLFEKTTLASIVEREAKNVDEMSRIAGVFQNRIEQDMRLESCATIQYVFGEPKKRLLNKDLRVVSPYNTYLHEGLPPGPISNPGLNALKAAFFPEDNDYLFFLAKKDGSNQHAFSRDYKEHLLMQKKYHR